MKNFRFYGIIDYALIKRKNAVKLARELILGGSDIIQLRFKPAPDNCGGKNGLSRLIKDARLIRRLANKHKIPLIINDRADVALAMGADGVHLGQCDLPISCARGILGKDKIIGISCHNLKQAQKAQIQGADYVSIGPVFKTPTKPEYGAVGLSLLKKAKDSLKIPFVAIGGINLGNLKVLTAAGAGRVAVVRAAARSKNIKKMIADFKSCLK